MVSKIVGFIIIVIGLYLFIVNIFHMRAIIIDDAFVEFRYARNLANGYGLRWNPAERPIEGYSNFFAILILWPFFLFKKINPIFISHLINIISTLMISFILYKLCRENSIDRLVALTVASIYISIPSSAKHSLTGLNTSLFIFILLLFFYIATNVKDKNNFRWYFIFLPTSYLLIILARPEGIFFASLLLFLLLFPLKRSRSDLFVSCVICYAIGILYLAWKFFYFGSILFSPFWVKVGNPWILPGKAELILFILRYATLFIFAFFGFIISKEKLISRYSAFFITLICLTYLFNHHIMGFDSRFFMPAIPFVLFLMAQALDKIVSLIIKKRYQYFFLVSTLLLVNHPNFKIQEGEFEFLTFNKLLFKGPKVDTSWVKRDIQIGKLLSKLKDISKIKILTEDSGAIGYYSDALVIDFLGHMHPPIAKIRDSIQRLRFIISFYRPDLVILRSERYNDYNNYHNFFEYFEKDRFIFLGRILDSECPPSYYYYNFWIRKDSVYFKEISDLLNEFILLNSR